jgi:hypothetical protein
MTKKNTNETEGKELPSDEKSVANSFFIHALEEMKPESTKALLSLYDYLILLFDF